MRVGLLLRYLLAVSLWLVIVTADLVLRVLCVFFIPWMMVWSKFSLDHTQASFQATYDLGAIFTRRWMRFPRLPLWRLLRRKGSVSAASEQRAGVQPGKLFSEFGGDRV